MSNGFSTYASYTELSSINEIEENQVVNNLTVTGKLTLANPLSMTDGGTNAITEDGVRNNFSIYSKEEVDEKFNYCYEEVQVGTFLGGIPVYRQFFSGTVTTAGAKIVLGTISNFETLIKVEGALVNSNGNWFSFPLSNTASTYASAGVLADGTVELLASNANCTYNLFYYYTKTKSGGGSGGGGGAA